MKPRPVSRGRGGDAWAGKHSQNPLDQGGTLIGRQAGKQRGRQTDVLFQYYRFSLSKRIGTALERKSKGEKGIWGHPTLPRVLLALPWKMSWAYVSG